MKKNLRNILVLAMGLMTTVSFAQDWNVDSRTRIDMGGDNDKMTTDQRATVGATWGGSDWGIHVSSDVNYTLGNDDDASMSIYEAYASADLMGFASVTAGRQAINNGSGALMAANDWSVRNTWEGMSFGFDLDMADITLGYHSSNAGGVDEEDAGNMWINAGGEFSGWNVNLLYMTDESQDDAATGIDISGEVMGAGVSASMNTDHAGNTMRVIGLSYALNDIGLNVAQTVYSEDGAFGMSDGNMGSGTAQENWASHGNMGHLGAGDEMLSYGLSYEMAGISMDLTMHGATSTNDDTRDVMEVSLGYSLSDNAGLALKYATDDATAAGIDSEATYMWLTLTVNP